MPLRRAKAVKIHCPIGHETLVALQAGQSEAIEHDPATAAVLEIIRGPNPLGDFTLYQGVCEIGFGWESFMPSPEATPTLGKANQRALSPTAVITTYAAANADINDALAELVAAHPWEVPVIEVSDVDLVVR